MRYFPNILTITTLVLGFVSLGAILDQAWMMGIRLLLWATLTSLVASSLAHRRDKETALGAELDALADLVVFGVAATVFSFQCGLDSSQTYSWYIAGFCAVAAALKLSRNNPSSPDWPDYQGLPVQAFGLVAVLLAIQNLSVWLIATGMLITAVLMVAPLRYSRVQPGGMGLILAGFVLIATGFEKMILLRNAVLWVCLFYVAVGWSGAFKSAVSRMGLIAKKTILTG